MRHYRVLIVGGGTAGIATAARLARAKIDKVAIIEPSPTHFYQPLWTLVGGGVVQRETTARPESSVIPPGVDWIRDEAREIDPQSRRVVTAANGSVGYDFLVVATGVKLNWDAIPGLREAVATPYASTNYDYDLAPKTWRLIRNFTGGTALFHMPGTPIKCPGAPQKIMYLAADHFRRRGISSHAKVVYGSAPPSIYGVKEYAAVLERVIERYGIDARFRHELVEVRPATREAIFRTKDGDQERRVSIFYDLLHVAPPQAPPDFVAASPLAGPGGWVEVDKNTLRHLRYPEVFALGDVAGTPNSKTGAAAWRQALVVADNMAALLRGQEPAAQYGGYVACPIVTAYGKMLLCEFDYSGRPTPTLTMLNTFRERRDMWYLKRYGLPWFYWNLAMRGRTLPLSYGDRTPLLGHAAQEATP